MDTDKMKEAIERSDDDRTTEMSDTEKLEEALDVVLIEYAEPASPIGIVRDAARLVLAAQSEVGAVEAAKKAITTQWPTIQPKLGNYLFSEIVNIALLAAKLHGGTSGGESGMTDEMVAVAMRASWHEEFGCLDESTTRHILEAALAYRSVSAPQVRDGETKPLPRSLISGSDAADDDDMSAGEEMVYRAEQAARAIKPAAPSLPPSGAQVTR